MDSHLNKLQRAITETIGTMNSADLTRHPEGKWCTAEVLEHLYLTYTGSIKGFERCLQAGRSQARTPRVMDHVRRTVVISFGYLPAGRDAPEGTRPRGMAAHAVVAGITAQIAALEKLITECETRYGERTRLLDHPVLGPLTGQQWRKFHWIHGRHHMKQIKNLCPPHQS